jgi:hypothetical protein
MWISRELENVPLSNPHVLDDSPRSVRNARDKCCSHGRWQSHYGCRKVNMRAAASQQIEHVLAQHLVAVHGRPPDRVNRVNNVGLGNTGRFQFGIARLLVLTTACAAIAALVMAIRVPAPSRLIVATYLLLMTGWLILRGPHIAQRLAQASAQRRRIAQTREEMLQFVRKQLPPNTPSAGDS